MLFRRLPLLAFLTLASFTVAPTQAQNYPTKPIRVVAPEAGGLSDLVARLMAQEIAASVGQAVVVENRPGGGGVIAAETVAKAASDGYTVLFHGPVIWLGRLFNDHVPYDPMQDFSYVTWAASAPNILAVHPSLPVRSVRDLITLTKARPGELNYAAGSVGSSSYLSAELLKALAGIDIVRIDYKGTGSALNALVSGEVQLMFGTAPNVLPYVKAGRLKALAVTSGQPSELAPGLSTLSASGLPGYEVVTMVGFFLPARSPKIVIDRLNHEVVRALKLPHVKERLLNLGAEVVASSPEAFAAAAKNDLAKWTRIVKQAGRSR